MCKGKGPDKKPFRVAKANEGIARFFQNWKKTVEHFRAKIFFNDEASLQMPGHGNRNNAKVWGPTIRRQ